MHGTPGLHDGLACGNDRWLEHGFGVIAPSRCGYGRTPIDHGKTYEEQADTYAALLDALNVDKVAIMANSSGGPAAYHFAARHPQRTAAIMTECAVSGGWSHSAVPFVQDYTRKDMMSSPLGLKEELE